MKGIFFIGILVAMGYFLYTFYGKESGVLESEGAKNLTDAPAVFKEKAHKAINERIDRMQGDLQDIEDQ